MRRTAPLEGIRAVGARPEASNQLASDKRRSGKRQRASLQPQYSQLRLGSHPRRQRPAT